MITTTNALNDTPTSSEKLFSARLATELDQWHLLKHPFYQDWTEGKLDLEVLRLYARQYYAHVKAFPRYVSSTHSNCEDLKFRQILLENLMEEDHPEKPHPELWKNFVRGLDPAETEMELSEQSDAEWEAQLNNEKLLPETQSLVDTFFENSRSTFEEGVGSLFAYERQSPEISKSKIDGLKKHYGISNPEVLEFFEVHADADVWHTEQTAEILDAMTDVDQAKARNAAIRASRALWSFLDGVQRIRQESTSSDQKE